jgi:hypothetical protein
MKPEMDKRLQALARQDAKNRLDSRFLNTMGFLVAKGLLGYNRPITEKPNAKLGLRDVIWAGENVEPRILEVLPAAFTRFERHFIIPENPTQGEQRLLEIRVGVIKNRTDLPDFFDIPYAKYHVWLNFPLSDRRTRPLSERKRMKTFRLRPKTIEHLSALAEKREMSETDLLEELIGGMK